MQTETFDMAHLIDILFLDLIDLRSYSFMSLSVWSMPPSIADKVKSLLCVFSVSQLTLRLVLEMMNVWVKVRILYRSHKLSCPASTPPLCQRYRTDEYLPMSAPLS